MTRLFFTTDVHASDRCFRKFLNAAKVYKADRLTLGGDITGKLLVPMVETADGMLRGALANLTDGKVHDFLLTSG